MAYFMQERHNSVPSLQPSSAVIKEAVGLFSNPDKLQDAIRALEGSAFKRSDISVMGNDAELKKVFGTAKIDPKEVMDNPDTPRQAPSRPEEQNIGKAAMVGVPVYLGAMGVALASGAVSVPALMAAAAIGGISGGAIGSVLMKLLGDNYNKTIEDHVKEGGLLLWVHTPTSSTEELAQRIMIKNGATDVHIQQII